MLNCKVSSLFYEGTGIRENIESLLACNTEHSQLSSLYVLPSNTRGHDCCLDMASEDSGMMTGAVIHYDQSVWGGYDSQAPAPSAPLTR